MQVWVADKEIHDLANAVKAKHHHPRLEHASVAVCFSDAKAFVNGRFNWGKTTKFTSLAKLFHTNKYEFLINLPSDGWYDILNEAQRAAWIDLRLCCCQVDYMPETIEENGVKKPLKDQWGRIQYTDVIKLDEDGNPKWKIVAPDLNVLIDNVAHYGAWCQDLLDFKQVIEKENERTGKVSG